jgi:UDP-N-acetylmuramate--alanine ligase
MKHALNTIHFVGIGGSGMSGIAEVLHRLGYRISGSDLKFSSVTDHLQSLGVRVTEGHAAVHLQDADVVVVSSAVAADNPEVEAARARQIPVVHRAVMLAELMRHRQGIAVAGTHGKTTTTGLLATLLLEAGMDPSFVIGGKLQSLGVYARLGQGDHLVVEADESDASFLHLLPVMSVVTNIDADHMATYGHDLAALRAAFVQFLHRMPFYGAAVLCLDDPGVASVLPMVSRPVRTYGVHAQAMFRAHEVEALSDGGMRFRCTRQVGARSWPDLTVRLSLSGHHNVLNALAAIAVATELKLDDEAVLRGLAGFAGMGRRFERHGPVHTSAAVGAGQFLLIDDYGHHPVEMRAVLSAARAAFPGRRLVLAFQPHRYSRTRDCFNDFVAVMAQADAILLTEVYAAGETPLAGADGQSLLRALRTATNVPTQWVADVKDLPTAILSCARADDVFLTMGAGSIGSVAQRVVSHSGGVS